MHGQKTGHFLDQRDNREYLGTLAEGAECSTCSPAPAVSRCTPRPAAPRRCVAVDLSEPTLAVAARNLHHNRASAGRRRVHVQARGRRRVPRDGSPGAPRAASSTSSSSTRRRSPSGRSRSAERSAAYAKLTDLGVRLVQPGGLLVQCSCSSRVTADDFHSDGRPCRSSCGPTARGVAPHRRTPIDHPVTFPEGAYLKAVFARVP